MSTIDIQTVRNDSVPQSISYFEQNLLDFAQTSTLSTPFVGDIQQDIIEFSLYDNNNTLIEWRTTQKFTVNKEGKLIIPIETYLDNTDSLVTENVYVMRLNTHRKVFSPPLPENFSDIRGTRRRELLRQNLGAHTGMKLIVDEVSQSRNEIRIIPRHIGTPKYDALFNQAFVTFFSQEIGDSMLKYVLNFGDNLIYHITNWSIDRDTFSDYPYSVVLKTYETLPSSLPTECWINEEISQPVFDRVTYFQTEPSSSKNVLANPNFNVDVNESGRFDTGKQTLASFMDQEDADITGLFENSLKLNIDYSDFSEFVKYSSARRRTEIYQEKKELIQRFEDDIDTRLTNDDGNPKSNKFNEYQQTIQRINKIKESFDGYETWLDNESTEPIENILEDARLYDQNNDESLVNTGVPEYIVNDNRNEQFIAMVNMIAHYFDIIFTYIKHMNYVSRRSYDIDMPESLSSELTQYVTDMLGYSVTNGFEGLSETASNTKTDQSMWRRLLHTIPYINETKGSIRSIEALLNIYGVPRLGRVIREYGGSDIDQTLLVNQFDQSVEGMFFGSESIIVDHGTFNNDTYEIMIRLKTEFIGNDDMEIVSSSDLTGTIDIENEELVWIISTTSGTKTIVQDISDFYINDGEYATISIQRSGEIYSFRIGKISKLGPYTKDTPVTATEKLPFYKEKNIRISDVISSSTETTFLSSFRGTVDNIKIWNNKERNRSEITRDMLAPFYKKPPTPTYLIDLFTEDYNNGDVTYSTGIDINEYERENWTPVFTSGANTSVNKIRSTESEIISGGHLSPYDRFEYGGRTRFSASVKDIDRLGVYFSPSKAIDRDIERMIPVQNINEYIAYPENEGYDTKLSTKNRSYWKNKKRVDWSEFFGYVDTFHKGLYKQLQNVVPARVKLTYGAVLEPHVLERHWVGNTQISRENLTKSVDLDPDKPVIDTSYLKVIDGIFNDNTPLVKASDHTIRGEDNPADIMEYTMNKYLYADDMVFKLKPPEPDIPLDGVYAPEDPANDDENESVYGTALYTLTAPEPVEIPEPEDDGAQKFRKVPFLQQIQFINSIHRNTVYSHNTFFQRYGPTDTYAPESEINDEKNESLYEDAQFSMLSPNELIDTPAGLIPLPERPYEDYRHYIFNREFKTADKQMKYEGVRWTNGPAVIVDEGDTGRIIVSPFDREENDGPILDAS